MGGHLAEIKTEEQNRFLASLAMLEEDLVHTQSWQIGTQRKKSSFIVLDTFSLTGLSDQGHEGRWVWQHSVEDVDFESWAPGQPEGIVSFYFDTTNDARQTV